MAKSIIDTPPKRSKLSPRHSPYWEGVSGGRGGVSLGYRRSARGAGTWRAKLVLDRQRIEATLGHADDQDSPAGALRYREAVAAALDFAKRQAVAIKTEATASKTWTVRSAVKAYVTLRKQRSERDGKIAEGRLRTHVLEDVAFADTALAKLRASSIEAWRGRLTAKGGLAPATINRLLNDLRAALNSAAESRRRELPPQLIDEIRIGTRAIVAVGEARKQLLSDGQIRRLVDAAFEVDEDFGCLVMLAAATGARFSQLAALRIANFQPLAGRLLMPGSRKGRTPKAKPPVPIPLAADVVHRLEAVVGDRAPDAPLLERWAFKEVAPLKWVRDRRRGWGAAYEIDKFWSVACQRAGLPTDTIMYALRHSSIVRGLRANLPVRLVASLHDTSIEMIEQHYAAFIADASEDLARRAVISFEDAS